jgi:HEAT repeat protein
LLELIGRPLVPGAAVDPNADSDARQALAALIRIPGAPQQAKQQLLTLLPRAEFVRTQVLIALAASEDPAVGQPAMAYLSDAQSQEGAAIAVARTHYAPGLARVRTDMRRPPNLRMVDETARDEDVFIRRRNAISAIAWTHDPTVAPDLIRIIEDPLDRRLLREVAGHSLAAVANDQVLEDIATRALDATKPEDTRLYYLYALRGRSTPSISNRLVQTYLRPGTSPQVMRAAAIAAGFGGDDSTAALLRPMLTVADASIKLNAAVAAVLCGDAPTAAALLDVLTTDRELPDLLSNVFVTRSTTGINTGVQLEPFDLLPLTEAMFTDGRIYRRINVATTLERGRGASHFDFAMVWLKGRVRQGWEDNVLGIGRFAARQRLREAAQGADEFRREMAFRMIRALNDKGSLLALRRGTGPAAERARQLLVEMTAAQ